MSVVGAWKMQGVLWTILLLLLAGSWAVGTTARPPVIVVIATALPLQCGHCLHKRTVVQPRSDEDAVIARRLW